MQEATKGVAVTRNESKQRPSPAMLVPEVPAGSPPESYPQRMRCATAAQLIGVSYSWLRKRTMLGQCPAVVRRGGRVTYDKDKLLQWESEN